jgi:excisionase family DNA binding protein
METVASLMVRQVKLLLTADEAADALGIKRTKLYSLVATGQIASVKIGALRRFPVQSLEAYVAQLCERQEVG